jgi:hypothetical protein
MRLKDKPVILEKKTTMKLSDVDLYQDIKKLILTTRSRFAINVNTELSLLYWHIGKKINTKVLQDKRAKYGKQIISSLSKQLIQEYGKGWSERQLWYCMRIADIFNNEKILHTLCAQLSWSHLRLLILITDPLKRNFYIELAKIENWSVRQLQERINS